MLTPLTLISLQEEIMPTLFPTTFRTCLNFGLFVLAFAFAFSGLAHASLPLSSNVPGGVAIIPLGSVSASADTPQTWLGDQPVLVTSDHDQWYAVVGLSLDMTPGSHEPVSYTHLRAHETRHDLVCRL